MEFSIATLGCKSNQFESQAMAKLLTQRGHRETQTPEVTTRSLDAYIINTCSVTAVSDKKSRQLIRKLKSQNPNTLIAVCGCYAQISPEEISALDVDLVGGTGNHLEFITQLESLFQTKTHTEESKPHLLPTDNPRQRNTIEDLPSGGLEGRTRALLKIQDGCENYCSYCIIPYTRGKLRSLSLSDSAQALQSLITEGFQEIVLTGIEISSWGKEFQDKKSLQDFLLLADEICAKEGVHLRLGSLEPRTITEEFCSIAKQCTSLHPHFHLSLQSGSDSVLKRMNRKYDSSRFLQSVDWLRQYFHNPSITTDLIVGFPQETQQEHEETLAFLQRCAFSSVHVFPYSKRSGTAADKMTGQLSNEVKSARSKEVATLTTAHQIAYQQLFLGQEVPVLFESYHKDSWTGHSPHYIPVSVVEASDPPLQNKTKKVKIIAQEHKGLVGELLP